MSDADDDRERDLAYDTTVMEGVEAYHAEEWPEGCPGPCHACERRMRERCEDSDGHVWPADFSWGDSCYCGQRYLLKRDDGRVEVKE